MKILVLEKFFNFKNNNKIKTKYTIQYNKNINRDKITVIFTRLKYKLDSKFLGNYPNLKTIVTPTTGINHIDLEYLKKKKLI